jgi:hypothetical protein
MIIGDFLAKKPNYIIPYYCSYLAAKVRKKTWIGAD